MSSPAAAVAVQQHPAATAAAMRSIADAAAMSASPDATTAALRIGAHGAAAYWGGGMARLNGGSHPYQLGMPLNGAAVGMNGKLADAGAYFAAKTAASAAMLDYNNRLNGVATVNGGGGGAALWGGAGKVSDTTTSAGWPTAAPKVNGIVAVSGGGGGSTAVTTTSAGGALQQQYFNGHQRVNGFSNGGSVHINHLQQQQRSYSGANGSGGGATNGTSPVNVAAVAAPAATVSSLVTPVTTLPSLNNTSSGISITTSAPSDPVGKSGGDGELTSAAAKASVDRMLELFHQGRQLLVKNLPRDCTEQELRATFGDLEVTGVQLSQGQQMAKLCLADPHKVLESWDRSRQYAIRGQRLMVSACPTEMLLCVARLPTSPQFTDLSLHRLASTYGHVKRCFLMRSPRTGKSKGYGFVEYSTKEAALQAKNLLDGKQLLPEEAGLPLGSAIGIAGSQHVLQCDWLDSSHVTLESLHSKCLFVKNLPRNYRDMGQFRQIFSIVVNPPYCQIALRNGNPQDWGLVEFTEADDAERTWSTCDGHRIGAQAIDVAFCIPGVRAINLYLQQLNEPVNKNKPALLPEPPAPTVFNQLQNLTKHNPQFAQNLKNIILTQIQDIQNGIDEMQNNKDGENGGQNGKDDPNGKGSQHTNGSNGKTNGGTIAPSVEVIAQARAALALLSEVPPPPTSSSSSVVQGISYDHLMSGDGRMHQFHHEQSLLIPIPISEISHIPPPNTASAMMGSNRAEYPKQNGYPNHSTHYHPQQQQMTFTQAHAGIPLNHHQLYHRNGYQTAGVIGQDKMLNQTLLHSMDQRLANGMLNGGHHSNGPSQLVLSKEQSMKPMNGHHQHDLLAMNHTTAPDVNGQSSGWPGGGHSNNKLFGNGGSNGDLDVELQDAAVNGLLGSNPVQFLNNIKKMLMLNNALESSSSPSTTTNNNEGSKNGQAAPPLTYGDVMGQSLLFPTQQQQQQHQPGAAMGTPTMATMATSAAMATAASGIHGGATTVAMAMAIPHPAAPRQLMTTAVPSADRQLTQPHPSMISTTAGLMGPTPQLVQQQQQQALTGMPLAMAAMGDQPPLVGNGLVGSGGTQPPPPHPDSVAAMGLTGAGVMGVGAAAAAAAAATTLQVVRMQSGSSSGISGTPIQQMVSSLFPSGAPQHSPPMANQLLGPGLMQSDQSQFLVPPPLMSADSGDMSPYMNGHMTNGGYVLSAQAVSQAQAQFSFTAATTMGLPYQTSGPIYSSASIWPSYPSLDSSHLNLAQSRMGQAIQAQPPPPASTYGEPPRHDNGWRDQPPIGQKRTYRQMSSNHSPRNGNGVGGGGNGFHHQNGYRNGDGGGRYSFNGGDRYHHNNHNDNFKRRKYSD